MLSKNKNITIDLRKRVTLIFSSCLHYVAAIDGRRIDFWLRFTVPPLDRPSYLSSNESKRLFPFLRLSASVMQLRVIYSSRSALLMWVYPCYVFARDITSRGFLSLSLKRVQALAKINSSSAHLFIRSAFERFRSCKNYV